MDPETRTILKVGVGGLVAQQPEDLLRRDAFSVRGYARMGAASTDGWRG